MFYKKLDRNDRMLGNDRDTDNFKVKVRQIRAYRKEFE
jgi:hypothetical protein